MTAILDKVLAAVAERQAEAETAFRDLAETIAAGDEPTAGAVAAVLRDAARSCEDLREAVGVVTRRQELRNRIDTEPEVKARQDELRQLIEAADAELSEATMRHGKTVVPILAELERLDQEVREILKAETELRSLLPTEIKAEIERLRQAAQDARDASIAAGKGIQGLEAIVQHAERDVYELSTTETKERLRKAQEALAQGRLTAAEREAEAEAALAEFKAAEAAAVA